MQMYKVFVHNTPLIFVKEENISKLNGIVISEKTALSDKKLVFELLTFLIENKSVFIFSKDPKSTFKLFFNEFEFIEAAGGIVKRKNSYLFIKRNGVWDLPKGKIDPGENSKTAAMREIHEECGILCSKINKLITSTFHVYSFNEKSILKKTYWYDLSYEGTKKTTVQLEEGITKAEWLKKDDIKKVIKNTYPSILDVLSIYFK
jgi:8-oxo-dGTP pyrophosphatase MutT (NUDIX family)